jgi:dienelactone hydrolase
MARLAVGRVILSPLLHLGGHYGRFIEQWIKEGKTAVKWTKLSCRRFKDNAALHQAVRYTAALPNVDPRRIGLAGFSLGASLALATAGAEDPQVRQIAAVVALFGCLPPDMREEIRGLPPTLMIQGDVDERVPPRAAYDFEKWLNGKKLPVEFKMYQRVGHVFDGAGLPELLDAQKRIQEFLRARLIREAPVAGGR